MTIPSSRASRSGTCACCCCWCWLVDHQAGRSWAAAVTATPMLAELPAAVAAAILWQQGICSGSSGADYSRGHCQAAPQAAEHGYQKYRGQAQSDSTAQPTAAARTQQSAKCRQGAGLHSQAISTGHIEQQAAHHAAQQPHHNRSWPTTCQQLTTSWVDCAKRGRRSRSSQRCAQRCSC